MNFQEMFEKIKKKTSKSDLKKIKEFMAIQINVTDEDCGGAFYVENKDNNFSVEPYDYKDKTAEIHTNFKDLTKLLEGKINVEKAIEDGKIFVQGNKEHIVAFFDAISKKSGETVKKAVKTVKEKAKPAAKKAVEKAKPAAKKAVEKAKPAAKKVVEKAKPAVKKVAEKAKPIAEKAVEKAKEKLTK